MQKMGFLIVSLCTTWVVLTVAVHAQVTSDQPACWFDYSDCAQQSAGDESWRSICYADFTECIGQKALPDCPSDGELKICIDYAVECKSLLKGNDDWAAQCSDDKDACELAHGC